MVTIRLRPTPGPAWDRIASRIAEDASLVAKLLAGEVPEAMEKVFQASGASFLPKSAAEVEADCSCPDTANPCKHIAAVHYLLAERFDQDPFLLFGLRGRSRDDVIGALHRPTPAPDAQPGPAPGAPGENAAPSVTQDSLTPAPVTAAEDLLSYWRTGARFASAACTPHPPVVALAVLRRIGEPTFCSPAQAKVLLQAITRVYQGPGGGPLVLQDGELMRVVLHYTLGPQALDGCYQVSDLLPSGLKAVTRPYAWGLPPTISYPYRIEGQRVSFCIWKNSVLRSAGYYARVVNAGEYTAEPVIIQSMKSAESVNLSAPDQVEIR